MKIENEIKTNQIEILVVDSERDYYPSYRILVKIKTEEIVGNFDREIWLSEAEIDDFLNRLERLNISRSGVETLRSMSPDEFELEFKNLDTLGHLGVKLILNKISLAEYSFQNLIHTEFEIDPTSLPKIISEMQKLKRMPTPC